MTVLNEQAEKAKLDYMAGMKYKDIAEKYGVSINTVKSWQKRHKWTREGAPKTEKGCTQNKKAGAPKGNKNAAGHGAPVGNKNALGNNGGPPPGNQNAATHSLYSKIIPKEDLELFEESGKVEGLEYELQVARYKVNRLILEQQQKQMSGFAGECSYRLQDDFYEQAILKGLEIVRRIEAQIHKAQIDKARLELERQKLQPPTPDELPDDGFVDALKAESVNIWANHGDDNG